MDQPVVEAAPTSENLSKPLLKEKLRSVVSKIKNLPKPVLIIGFIVIGFVLTYSTYLIIDRFGEKDEPLVQLNGQPILLGDRDIEMKASMIDSIGVEVNSGFTLTSEKMLDAEALNQTLHVTPDVPLTITQASEFKVVVQPAAELTEDTVYTFALDKGAVQGVDDTIPYKWAFQTKDTFSVSASIPTHTATYVPVNTGIEVTFSHENFADPLDHVTIEPTVNLKFERHLRTAVFIPESLQKNTIYTFTVKSTLPLTGSDETLGTDFVVQFETESDSRSSTENYEQFFAFSKQSIEVAPGTTPAAGVYAYSFDQTNKNLNVSVYKFKNVQDYLDEDSHLRGIPTWSTGQRDRYVPAVEGLEKVTTFTTQMQQSEFQGYILFPEPLGEGFYIAVADNGTYTQSILVQVTPLTAFHTVSSNKSYTWVHSAVTQEPISQAQVTIVPNISAGKTNATGLLEFDSTLFPNEEYTAQVLLITDGEHNLVIPSKNAQSVYNPYNFSRFFDYWASDSDYWSYLYTDKPIYQQTDTLRVWGIVKHRDNPLETVNARVMLKKSQDDVLVQSIGVTADEYGSFEGSLQFKNLEAGYYNAQVTVGDEVLQTVYVHIKPYTKPAFIINVSTEGKGVYADEPIKYSGQVEFYSGAPVSQMELKYYPEGRVTADENGQFSLERSESYDPAQNYPTQNSLRLEPALAEAADISGSATVTVFGPAYDIEADTSYPSDNQYTATATVHAVDIAAFNQGESYKKALTTSVQVTARITEGYYDKREDGQYYDFVSKTVKKKYKYELVRNLLESVTIDTNASGSASYTGTLNPDRWYEVEWTVVDNRGRSDKVQTYAYQWGQYGYNPYASQYQLNQMNSSGEQDGYSIDDEVSVRMGKEGIPLENAPNRFLFLKAQRGIHSAQVQSEGLYSFTFSEIDMPNTLIQSVYFTGATYETSEQSIRVNQDSRTLTIEAVPAKEQYVPGEEVVVQLRTTDNDGAGVPALVNLSVVDEAVFAIEEQYANPVYTVYETVVSGISFSYSSHQYPIDRSQGEMGAACFTGDTQVHISPTQTKAIKDLKPGDSIYTFGTSLNDGLIQDTVTSVEEHAVTDILIINGLLEVTPEHVVYINGKWMPVGDAKVGDILTNKDGEKVYITSIETRVAPVTVYNIHVQNNHTFIANDIYVHNDKGSVRSKFVDTPYFGSVTTDRQGNGIARFALPDNLTEWRITTHGVTRDLLVGNAKSAVYSTKPFFVQPSINKTYLADDKPIVVMRAFGEKLLSNDRVSFAVTIPSLGWESPQTYDARGFEKVEVALPNLSVGMHEFTVAASSGTATDTVKQSFSVVSSYTAQKELKEIDLSSGGQLDEITTPTLITFANAKSNRMYTALSELFGLYVERSDFLAVKQKAGILLREYFNTNYGSVDFSPGEFQKDKGIALLPYSSPDPMVSAQIALVANDLFDAPALSQYFESLRLKDATSFDVLTASLLGSASLHDPVIDEIYRALDTLELSLEQRLRLIAGLALLGDNQRAYNEYALVINEFGENADPYIRIKDEESQDQSVAKTALALIIATELTDSQAEGMFRYITEFSTQDTFVETEQLFYIQKTLPLLTQEPVGFSYSVRGETNEITLKDTETFSVWVNPDDDFEIKNIQGQLGATLEWNIPFQNTEDTNIKSIQRRFLAVQSNQLVPTTEISEDSIVRVEIDYNIQNGYEGCYLVTERLPSGLRAISRSYSDFGYTNPDHIYPYRIDENALYFCIPVKDSEGNTSGTLSYYARVASPGTYVYEGTVIQSSKVLSDKAKGEDTSITILPR